MRLSKEVLIEAAEQAEALPVGTVAYYDPPEGIEFRETRTRFPGDEWAEDGWYGSGVYFDHAEMVGWTALVPIEAEEETTSALGWYGRTVHESSKHTRPVPSRRLVTPWEPA